MRRYLAAALVIGTMAATVVLVLWQWIGWGAGMTTAFHDLYQRLGLVPPQSAPIAAAVLCWISVAVTAIAVAWCAIDIPKPELKMVAVGGIATVILGLSPSLALFSSVLQTNRAASDPGLAAARPTYWLLDPVAALFAGALALGGGLAYGQTSQGRRKRLLVDLAGNRFSRASLANWVDADEPLPLHGEMRELSVVRCRIFNMSQLQERLSAAELLRAGNEFLRAAGDFLVARGAFLDECAADGVRAVFGLPKSDNCAADACAAALELRTRLTNLALEHESRWNIGPEFGVGIASGPIAIGSFGSHENGRLGFIGSLLEDSRRLCDSNETMGSRLLIDERTRTMASERIEVRSLALEGGTASGLGDAHELLAAAGALDEAARRRRDHFNLGIARLREQRAREALECFELARDSDRPDVVLDRMTGIARALQQ